jgi:hypothetical protein
MFHLDDERHHRIRNVHQVKVGRAFESQNISRGFTIER